MNQDILKGKWMQLKGTARKKWGKLTDDDLDRIQGNAEIMIGVIQERYGYGREQAEREIKEFLSSSDSGTVQQPGHTQPQTTRPDQDDEKRRRVS